MAEVGSLKKGDYIVYEDAPYYVAKKTPVVVSRHSHAKTKLEITHVITGERKTLTLPDSAELETVDIIRKHGQLISKLEEGVGQVMDMKDYSIIDASIPQGLEVKEGDEVTFIEFGGRAYIIALREKR
jgi:translation elongation factor P/translation initiation factor 5A